MICLDLGGPALQVSQETGIKVAATSPEQVVGELVRAMLRFSGDPALSLRMGKASRQRAKEDFHWGKKGDSMHQICERTVTHAGG